MVEKQGKIVIEGDVSCSQVIAQLAPYCGNILSGGIACQPWSLLGDQREMSDDRSRSMPGMLRAIHFLQIPLAVMECTPAVLQSKEEQDILRKICIRNRYGGSPENFVTASVLAIQTPEMVGNPVPSSIGYQANTRHATTRICTVDDSSFSVFYGA